MRHGGFAPQSRQQPELKGMASWRHDWSNSKLWKLLNDSRCYDASSYSGKKFRALLGMPRVIFDELADEAQQCPGLADVKKMARGPPRIPLTLKLARTTERKCFAHVLLPSAGLDGRSRDQVSAVPLLDVAVAAATLAAAAVRHATLAVASPPSPLLPLTAATSATLAAAAFAHRSHLHPYSPPPSSSQPPRDHHRRRHSRATAATLAVASPPSPTTIAASLSVAAHLVASAVATALSASAPSRPPSHACMCRTCLLSPRDDAAGWPAPCRQRAAR